MKVVSWVWYGLLFFVIMSVDRITKMLAIMYCQDTVNITSLLSFDLTFNRGISWSMFHADAWMPFVLVSGMVALVTLVLAGYACVRYVNQQLIFGEVMVLAGSCSNIIDRVVYGGVADFIRVHYQNWSYPTFNVADVSIVIGVVCMMWEYYKE